MKTDSGAQMLNFTASCNNMKGVRNDILPITSDTPNPTSGQVLKKSSELISGE